MGLSERNEASQTLQAVFRTPWAAKRQHCLVDWIDSLLKEAAGHRAVGHPYLRALAEGEIPAIGFALADFARQYAVYSAYFPRYLAAVMSKLVDPNHRHCLLTNLQEESGTLGDEALSQLAATGIQAQWVNRIPHPELFRRFQHALGVSSLLDTDPEAMTAVCWREMFYSLLVNGSAAEAVGAISFGTEAIVRHVYPPILDAIRRYGRLQRQDYVFFELHCLVDDDHTDTLLTIAASLAQDHRDRADLRKGMFKALFLRASFWDHLHHRALAQGRA
jgi:pyrroloquinoline quinone (PQQ) biosynthesis protein C